MKTVPKKFREFERLLREINWNVTLKGREILKEFNSSPSQLQCLSILYFCKESEDICEMTMGELAKRIDMSFSSTTGLVDRLVSNHLINRKRSSQDRRKVIIQLSSKGESLIKEIIRARQHYLQGLSRNIDSSEITTIVSTLKKLKELMKES